MYVNVKIQVQTQSKAERSGTDGWKSLECQLKRACQWQTTIPSLKNKGKTVQQRRSLGNLLRALARKRGDCFLGAEGTFLTIWGRDWEFRKLICSYQSVTDLIKYPISAGLTSIRSLETIGSAASHYNARVTSQQEERGFRRLIRGCHLMVRVLQACGDWAEKDEQ